jgi:hypothetical protein
MQYKFKVVLLAVCFFAFTGAVHAQLPGALSKNPLSAKNPSPELIGQLTKQLKITPEQAIGGSGAIFGLTKTKLSPTDFLKVSDAVPGMDGLLKAAPKQKQEAADPATDMLGALTSALPGKAGAMASVAGSFKQLGMSPEMAIKFLPIMTQFVKVKGGTEAAGLLSGVFK